MPDRLIHKADFESLMSAPTWSRSAHFSVHHVARRPHSPSARRRRADSSDLSTDLSEPSPQVVDKLPERIWIGAMVPKRQARRAVMRNLLKRQIRNAFERHDALLPRGLWLVRLRRGFAAADFVSASSRRLAKDVRAELDELLRRVPPPPRRATSPR